MTNAAFDSSRFSGKGLTESDEYYNDKQTNEGLFPKVLVKRNPF